MKRRLLITLGDPAGVGPEVLLASLRNLRIPSSFSVTLIGDRSWLARRAGTLFSAVTSRKFDWIDLPNVPRNLIRGRVQPAAGAAAYEYLEEAVALLKKAQAQALVTAPVSKEAIARAGIPWVGHTEFLAQSFRAKTVMMFVTGNFRASLVTTHAPLRGLAAKIKKPDVVRILSMTREALRKDFGIPRPRIGLAALNPHGGEGGLFGAEEKRILRPAAQAAGAGVVGPLPADSLMQAAARGQFDAVVALYHDQALIPVKLLGWEKAVNVTLGLPIVRTSPVHGTAFDIAGTGRADSRSMQSAIHLAIHLARQRC